MVGLLFQSLQVSHQRDYVVVVTGDHTTPTILGDHSYHPVPIAIASLNHVLKQKAGHSLTPLKDNVILFTEVACA